MNFQLKMISVKIGLKIKIFRLAHRIFEATYLSALLKQQTSGQKVLIEITLMIFFTSRRRFGAFQI